MIIQNKPTEKKIDRLLVDGNNFKAGSMGQVGGGGTTFFLFLFTEPRFFKTLRRLSKHR